MVVIWWGSPRSQSVINRDVDGLRGDVDIEIDPGFLVEPMHAHRLMTKRARHQLGFTELRGRAVADLAAHVQSSFRARRRGDPVRRSVAEAGRRDRRDGDGCVGTGFGTGFSLGLTVPATLTAAVLAPVIVVLRATMATGGR